MCGRKQTYFDVPAVIKSAGFLRCAACSWSSQPTCGPPMCFSRPECGFCNDVSTCMIKKLPDITEHVFIASSNTTLHVAVSSCDVSNDEHLERRMRIGTKLVKRGTGRRLAKQAAVIH